MRKLLKTTSDSHTYNVALYWTILKETVRCIYCPFYGGDNPPRPDRKDRSWKRYRKTQYKAKG